MFITVIMLITELSLRCIPGRLGGEMAKEDLGGRVLKGAGS